MAVGGIHEECVNASFYQAHGSLVTVAKEANGGTHAQATLVVLGGAGVLLGFGEILDGNQTGEFAGLVNKGQLFNLVICQEGKSLVLTHPLMPGNEGHLGHNLAKLSGGVGVIKVGAATEVEAKERKHRIEDAVSSTRAALEEGIVAGGGTALVHALAALDGFEAGSRDAQVGVDIVRRALVQPLRWIAENAGEDGYVVTSKVAELPIGHGFNAATRVYEDLIARGVIDPVKVTRSALENAASIAALVLTTETLVVEKPAEEEDNK